MPKSKHRSKHFSKLNIYKSNKKKEQELFKKKMIDNYMKIQQEALANQEAHTSTQEVTGPDINIDALNDIEKSQEVTGPDINIEALNEIESQNLDDTLKEVENIGQIENNSISES